MRRAIPLASAEALRPLARRTTIVRAAAAVGLLALALAAILVGRHPHVRTVELLPERSTGVIVLDLSASISTDTYSRIAATVNDLVSSHGRYGLVIFSDTAYEALPPGTPAEALAPLARFFAVPRPTIPGAAPTFPVNPWTNTFSGGTRISSGLDLARAILFDRRLGRASVLLVSDLDDDQADLPALNQVIDAYRNERIQLNVVALNASEEDQRLFRRFGLGAFTQAHLPGHASRNVVGARFPIWLVVAALALALMLALNEVWNARLTWTEPRGAEA